MNGYTTSRYIASTRNGARVEDRWELTIFPYSGKMGQVLAGLHHALRETLGVWWDPFEVMGFGYLPTPWRNVKWEVIRGHDHQGPYLKVLITAERALENPDEMTRILGEIEQRALEHRSLEGIILGRMLEAQNEKGGE